MWQKAGVRLIHAQGIGNAEKEVDRMRNHTAAMGSIEEVSATQKGFQRSLNLIIIFNDNLRQWLNDIGFGEGINISAYKPDV